MQATDFNFEKKRKIFHLTSIIFPLVYMFIPKLYMLSILFLITPIILYIDTSRHYNAKIKIIVNNFFEGIIRKNEESGTFKLSGASFMCIGFLFSALLFSKGLAITSWLVLIIADPLAALIGIKIGTPHISGKSLEGAFAFLSASIFVSIICYFFIGYDTSFMVIIISSSLTALGEFYSKKISIDDNLLIPITYCFSTIILNLIL